MPVTSQQFIVLPQKMTPRSLSKKKKIHTVVTVTHCELHSSLWEFSQCWDFCGEKMEHESVPVTHFPPPPSQITAQRPGLTFSMNDANLLLRALICSLSSERTRWNSGSTWSCIGLSRLVLTWTSSMPRRTPASPNPCPTPCSPTLRPPLSTSLPEPPL